MKKSLLFAFSIITLVSCNDSKPPKEVAKEFINAVYLADGAAASLLASEKTKMSFGGTKAEAPQVTADESFSFATLTETITGNTAEVKNEMVKISLEKENDGWKVLASPELVAGINEKQKNVAELKNRWDALLKEYEGRLLVAKEYVNYKKGSGSFSQQMKTLEEMVNTLSTKTTWDRDKILLYVQKQKQLDDLIDKALEPSYSASSDISMNYFLQLSNAGDRIRYAQGSYQELAEKTSSPAYPPLPFKATNSMKVN